MKTALGLENKNRIAALSCSAIRLNSEFPFPSSKICRNHICEGLEAESTIVPGSREGDNSKNCAKVGTDDNSRWIRDETDNGFRTWRMPKSFVIAPQIRSVQNPGQNRIFA
jgi:hypothetical protein